jgi:hypothetical protein
MSIDAAITEAVALALAPVLAELRALREEVAELRTSLPPRLLPLKEAAKRLCLDGRTLVSRYPHAVVRVGRKILFDAAKLRPTDPSEVERLARAARGNRP